MMTEVEKLDELNQRLEAAGFDLIHSIDDFDEVLEGTRASQVLFMFSEGKFNTQDEYFEYNEMDSLISYKTIDDARLMYSDIK